LAKKRELINKLLLSVPMKTKTIYLDTLLLESIIGTTMAQVTAV
jgi:hypothetical protein